MGVQCQGWWGEQRTCVDGGSVVGASVVAVGGRTLLGGLG